ncbi:hypothetical protein PO909_001452, partial [Leuciscus waleckii]
FDGAEGTLSLRIIQSLWQGSSFIRVLQRVQPRGMKLKDAVLEERVSRLHDRPTPLSSRDLPDPPSPFQSQMEREGLVISVMCVHELLMSLNWLTALC